MARRDESSARLRVALLVASLLHVGSVVSTRAVLSARATDSAADALGERRTSSEERESQEIMLLDEPPGGELLEQQLAVRRRVEVEPSTSAPQRARPSPKQPETSIEGSGGGEAPYSLDARSLGSAPATGSTTGSLAMGSLPGLGGAPVWLLADSARRFEPPAPAPTTTPRLRFDPDAATKAIDATMLGLDAKKGLLPPATTIVAAALEEAAMQTPMPPEARAQFAASFAADHTVASIRVLSFTAGSRSAWDSLVRLALGKMAGRPLDVGRLHPPFSFAIRFTTEVLYPSGSKEPTEMVDVGTSPRQVVHAFVELRGAGATALPSDVAPQTKRGPWSETLPKGVVPVELNPDKH